MYIPEYMSHISVFYIQFYWNYHRETLRGLSILQIFSRNWPVILSPPGDAYMWRTVHNCIIQLSNVCGHYGIQKFVKFSTLVSDKLLLKNMMILFLWENLQHFVKQIVQKKISSIFSICYCQIGKRLWWIVCCVQWLEMMFSCSVALELSNYDSCQSLYFCILIQLSFCLVM